MSDMIERPTDAADPTYPDAERCAQTLEACEDDLLTEAQFVRWQGQEIERLTAERNALRADLLAGRNVVNAGLTIHTLTLERDELRRQLAEAWAEREAMANVLPGYYYMDPPDGGDVSVLEQLRRMAKDAERYRWLRPRFFAADFAYSDPPVCAIVFRWPESAKISANLDREIDAAMGASNE